MKEVSKDSDTNYPKLQNVWAVRFKRGLTKMEWKSKLRGTATQRYHR